MSRIARSAGILATSSILALGAGVAVPAAAHAEPVVATQQAAGGSEALARQCLGGAILGAIPGLLAGSASQLISGAIAGCQGGGSPAGGAPAGAAPAGGAAGGTAAP